MQILARVGILVFTRASYQAVFFEKIGRHVPLPTVPNRCFQQALHQSPVQVFLSSIEYLFQEIICFLQFVPVEEISLAQLKLFKVIFRMIATRNKLEAANIQQRPVDRWFVTGDPSRLIFVLKF